MAGVFQALGSEVGDGPRSYGKRGWSGLWALFFAQDAHWLDEAGLQCGGQGGK